MIRLATGIALTAALLLPSACVSMEYGPITPERPYGYSDRKGEDGAYIVTIVHPDSSMAMAFWDARAKELCGSAGYTKNIYEAVRVVTYYSSYGPPPGVVVVEGVLTCNGAGAAHKAAD